MDAKDEIKLRIDIAELIGGYLDLRPAGSGSFKAICPFHSEKSPSFHVSKEKQIWHCFGCSEGGDCFSFVMKMEGVDFPEAMRVLGKRAGVEVPRFSSAQSNENQRLVQVNEYAANVYQKILRESPNAEAARVYVAKRGITGELAETFRLGFAPDGWDTLTRLLEKKGIRLIEAQQGGLVQPRKSGQGFIDRFRSRLMIPLCDGQGNVVAFTGRILKSEQPDDGPKYMNSPETPIYHKGELLFGLHLAKQAIKREKSVIIVEGNLDVIASHKAGVENVVASSGTALTERQLDLLKRLTETLLFAFDQDAAGFAAAQRGIRLARARGFDVRVALIPPEAGKDPDEAVQKDPEFWRRAVQETIPVMQYFVDRAVRGRDLSKVEEKRAASDLLLPELATIENVVEREHWLQTVGDLLRVDADILRRSLPGAAASAASAVRAAVPTAAKPAAVPAAPAAHPTRAMRAAESLLALLLHHPEWQKDAIPQIDPADIPEGEYRELYNVLVPGYTHSRFPPDAGSSYFGWISGILKGDADLARLLPFATRLAMLGETTTAGLPSADVRKQLSEHIQTLGRTRLDQRRKELEGEIRRAEAQGDRETVSKLLNEFNSLR